MSRVAYVGFGANLGERAVTFRRAVDALKGICGVVVTRVSQLYETDPVGLCDNGPRFLNAVVELETDLAPRALMEAIRKIEPLLGKAPDHRSDKSRVADLDLLLYGDEIIDEADMTIPHPRMHQRGFVLVPLAELNSEIVIPTLDRTAADLLHELPVTDREGVRPAATWQE
jgi:2-amino-4-hydroxy-6-hydroxymethyldihydropteridine diphosphokinase